MNTRKAFCKLAASASMALLVGWSAQPAYASNLDFTFYNESGRSIIGIYVRPTNSSTLGRDLLGRDVLLHGENIGITFPGPNTSCPNYWDVTAVYSSGAVVEKRFNLCATSRIVAD